MNPITRALRRASAALLVSSVSLTAQSASQQASPTQPDATELVKQARKLNGDGKQDEALAAYLRAVKLSPDLFDAHLGAGTTLDLMGRYEEARQHLARAIDLAPPQSRTQAWRTMAVSFAFERKAKEASKYEVQAFESQLAAQDFNAAAETANELARIYLESGDVDDAYTWYHTGNETARRQSNLTDSARTLWDFRWEHAQARIAARRGKHDEARIHVAAAKAALDKGTNPDQVRFFPHLTGYVAFYAADYPTALADLQNADQRDPFILSLIAQAYEKSGDRTKATEYYRMALTSNAHNPPNAFARPLARKKVS
jgi:tetratricopeptide (TPR) repeat protein